MNLDSLQNQNDPEKQPHSLSSQRSHHKISKEELFVEHKNDQMNFDNEANVRLKINTDMGDTNIEISNSNIVDLTLSPSVYLESKQNPHISHGAQNPHHQYERVKQPEVGEDQQVLEEQNDSDEESEFKKPIKMLCPHCGHFGSTKAVRVCTFITFLRWVGILLAFIFCICCICLYQPEGDNSFSDNLECKCLQRSTKHQCKKCKKLIELKHPDKETFMSMVRATSPRKKRSPQKLPNQM